ncbi:phasin family protein [Pseudoduganella namucuonensis]|uniref:Phasin protein n=1 Tax=Pseudoduganella namucuonensis TaxID=1035707 RepID=A0A1I7IN56_9BURK|nr:phasin family protein [Pseudoduganella namucuonensis]SFU74338.1 Phasin protein [Pseudoduganella namucuonensis]
MYPNATENTDARSAFASLQLNAFNWFGSLAVDSMEKIVTLNIATAKAATENFQRLMHSVLLARSSADLVELGAKQRESNAEATQAYGSELSAILTNAKDDFSAKQRDTTEQFGDAAQALGEDARAVVDQNVADYKKGVSKSRQVMEDEGGIPGTTPKA